MNDQPPIIIIADYTAGVPWWVWFALDLFLCVAKCALSAFVAGALVFLTSTQTVEWSSLSSFAQNCIWLGAAVAVAKDILSFLSTALGDLHKRKQPNTNSTTP